MDIFLQFWSSVTEPQAAIVSALLTILAAVLGVLLGAALFGNRVKTLGDALNASDKLLRSHKEVVEAQLTEMRLKLLGFDAAFATTSESLGQLRGSIGDLQSTSVAVVDADPADDASREQLRSDWEAIRDQLERLAANPQIDGRTRARYARIDRRRYGDLVNSLADDDRLGTHAGDYRAAIALWHQYRNGRRKPVVGDVRRMQELRQALAPDQQLAD